MTRPEMANGETDDISNSSALDSQNHPSRELQWVVQKFGGTSIGKFPLNVLDNVIE